MRTDVKRCWSHGVYSGRACLACSERDANEARAKMEAIPSAVQRVVPKPGETYANWAPSEQPKFKPMSVGYEPAPARLGTITFRHVAVQHPGPVPVKLTVEVVPVKTSKVVSTMTGPLPWREQLQQTLSPRDFATVDTPLGRQFVALAEKIVRDMYKMRDEVLLGRLKALAAEDGDL